MTKIAIDLDGVCFDFVGGFASTHGSPEFPRKYSMHEMYPSLPRDVIQNTIADEKTYWMSQPIENAVDAMNALNNIPGIEMEYVTIRPKHLQQVSVMMLVLNRFPTLPLVMMDTFPGKIAYINEEKFDMVLDDNTEVVQGVNVKFPYLFTQPWNIEFPWEFRVNGWREFYARFLIQP